MRALPALLIFCCALATAQQYRWIDDKGRVQYSDTPPPASAKDVQRKRFGDSGGAANRAEGGNAVNPVGDEGNNQHAGHSAGLSELKQRVHAKHK